MTNDERRIWVPAGEDHFLHHLGEYQEMLVAFIAAVMVRHKNHRTAVDVGAHIGHMTYNMLNFDRVISIEPHPDNYKCLIKNITPHVENKNVKWFPLFAAASNINQKGQITMYNPGPGNSGANEIIRGPDGNIIIEPTQDKTKEHMVITIDSLKLDDVDLIKIDVQGCENLVIEGAEQTLKRCQPVVVMEVWMNGKLNDSVINLMTKFGYGVLVASRKDAILVPHDKIKKF